MTDPATPAYHCIEVTTLSDAEPVVIQGGPRLTASDGGSILVLYLERKRDVLIAELREIDRLLGRSQTIPVRDR